MRQNIYDRLGDLKGSTVTVNGKSGTLNDYWDNGDKIRLELYIDNDGAIETDETDITNDAAGIASIEVE
jgi:hypothetical protein